MENYTVIGRIGEGAHGVVVRARHNTTGETVALKKVPIKRLDQGMPASALREIKALQEINSENVVRLLDVFAEGMGFVLVFELMQGDLGEMTKDVNNTLTDSQVKSYMKMLLSGVQFLHNHNIMHRVATRWYRSPELLYGARVYNEGVDLWAVGCIFGEMINFSPVFPGESDIDQLRIVLQTLGTPTEELWPGLSQLPDYKKITFPEYVPVPLERVLPDAQPDALDLIKMFLIYNSDQRISAKKALQHVYFSTYPLAAKLGEMPLPPKNKRPPPASQEYPIDIPVRDILKEGNDLLQELLGEDSNSEGQIPTTFG